MEHTKTATVVTTRTHTIRLTRADLLALLPKKLRDAAVAKGSTYVVGVGDALDTMAVDATIVDDAEGDRIILTITEQVTR